MKYKLVVFISTMAYYKSRFLKANPILLILLREGANNTIQAWTLGQLPTGVAEIILILNIQNMIFCEMHAWDDSLCLQVASRPAVQKRPHLTSR